MESRSISKYPPPENSDEFVVAAKQYEIGA